LRRDGEVTRSIIRARLSEQGYLSKASEQGI
jgi:hypothetical protein